MGPGEPCFLIAEAGVNHNGSLARALEMVEAAARAGADAVKFQSFNSERLAAPGAPLAEYQEAAIGGGQSQLEMLKALELDPDQHRALKARCQKLGILFLSTPFDEACADFLDELGVPAFKVGSGELTNLPLLEHLAAKKKPLILSTGMSRMSQVEAAVGALRGRGLEDLVLLHCVSQYPAPAGEANLLAMEAMRQRFGVPVGFSDHTLGVEIGLAAVALGASVLEKHFTLDRGLPGPDHQASLMPEELGRLCRGARRVQSALGSGRKEPSPVEAETALAARRSLVAARDIGQGEVISAEAISILRPGTGIGPDELPKVLGRKAARAIAEGEVLKWEMIQ